MSALFAIMVLSFFTAPTTSLPCFCFSISTHGVSWVYLFNTLMQQKLYYFVCRQQHLASILWVPLDKSILIFIIFLGMILAALLLPISIALLVLPPPPPPPIAMLLLLTPIATLVQPPPITTLVTTLVVAQLQMPLKFRISVVDLQCWVFIADRQTSFFILSCGT